jgi:nicotinamide phosphoribosyltransferase
MVNNPYYNGDTFGFAMKSTYGVVKRVPKSIYKNPKTDDGLKNSAKGLLKVNNKLELEENVTPEEEK